MRGDGHRKYSKRPWRESVLKSCVPFGRSSSLAPIAYGCAGGGADCADLYGGGSGACVFGAGLLPEPGGFPAPPAMATTASSSSGPVISCQAPQTPAN